MIQCYISWQMYNIHQYSSIICVPHSSIFRIDQSSCFRTSCAKKAGELRYTSPGAIDSFASVSGPGHQRNRWKGLKRKAEIRKRTHWKMLVILGQRQGTCRVRWKSNDKLDMLDSLAWICLLLNTLQTSLDLQSFVDEVCGVLKSQIQCKIQ